MSKHCLKHTKTYLLFALSFIILTTTGCSLFSKNHGSDRRGASEVFLRGQNLVLNKQFDVALPYLNHSLKLNDQNYDATLLLSARAYDQVGQPEKAVLALQELLTKKIDIITELKTRTLLLKNTAKVGEDISTNEQKRPIQAIVQSGKDDSILILESLKWSTEFTCDEYCPDEVKFLKEIQLQYLYIVENDESASDRASDTILERYDFFFKQLTKTHLQESFRRLIATELLESIQKLKVYELEDVTEGAARAKKLVDSVNLIQPQVEAWLQQ